MLVAPLLLLPTMLQDASVTSRLAAIDAASQGRLGAAIIRAQSSNFVNKNERFSLQSVMKLVVAMAALDQVDRGRWKREQKFTFRRSDLSLSVQPVADLLGRKNAITVPLSTLIELMVTQSCSGSGDFVIRKLGGTSVVNAFLKKNHIVGMSVDRQERDLQTYIGGIQWKPEYVDARKLDFAFANVSLANRDAAYRRYMVDSRDTTTPAAMGSLLLRLLGVKLLSPASTKYLLGVMERTETGADRLKAGVPLKWILAHKTGTSSTHRGIAAATNDVGVARNSKGDWVILVALLRNSTLAPEGRAEILSQVAKVAFSP